MSNLANPNIKVGDRAKVVNDTRAIEGEQFADYFRDKIGQAGKVTYVDQELISLKFEDDYTSIAYWRNEVEQI